MTKELPDNIQKDLEKACNLHQRATSDYEKCVEFNKLTSDLLARLEDEGHDRLARDWKMKVMSGWQTG